MKLGRPLGINKYIPAAAHVELTYLALKREMKTFSLLTYNWTVSLVNVKWPFLLPTC